MAKLQFKPVTYQFYYRCRPGDGMSKRAAGFRWDPIRRRCYTEDPLAASALAADGDSYVRELLADVLAPAPTRKTVKGTPPRHDWLPIAARAVVGRSTIQ